MTNNETHLSKGTTKEGKEVVGYYCKISGADCIIKQDAKREVFTECMGLPQNDWVLITSPPQKCLGIRDCEGELMFERDELEYLWQGKIETITASLEELGSINDFLFFTEFKIIHPTNIK